MAEYTANYRLKKPDRTDYYNVADFNSNSDIIDKYVKQNLDESKSYTDSKNTEAVAEATTYTDSKITETKDWAVNTFINPNLLINGDFQVWQRGESFSGGVLKYTADRWQMGWGTDVDITVEKVDNGIKVSSNVASASPIRQYIENPERLAGKTLTLSFEIAETTGTVNVYYNAGSSIQLGSVSEVGVHSFTFTCPSSVTKLCIFLQTPSTAISSFVLKWTKLELGSVATPFVPRLYGEELALCQRYNFVSNSSIRIRTAGVNSSEIYFFVPLPNSMRINPTVPATETGKISVATLSSGTVSGFAQTAEWLNGNGIFLRYTKTAHGLSDAHLVIDAGAVFDAEIY